jgi:hypothetical protein
MLKVIGYVILFMSNVSALPAIWIGRKERSVLWSYALACFTADALSFTFRQFHINHSIVSNLFLITEFVLIATYFKLILIGKSHKYAFLAIVSTVCLLFAWRTVVNTIRANSDAEAFNYKDAAWFSVCYMLLSIAGLYKVMSEMETVRIEQSPLFLSCVAILLYASGTLFPFIYKDIVLHTEPEFEQFKKKIWPYFFLPLNIIKNVLLAFSLHCVLIAKNE